MKNPVKTDMSVIGKWIIFEGLVYDRWVYRKITGETEKFWILQACRPDGSRDDIPKHKKKKSSLGRYLIVDDQKKALELSQSLTQDLAHAADTYQQVKKNIITKHLQDM